MIEYLNFDLKVYTVFGPLTSILCLLQEKMAASDQETFRSIEDECLKLARRSFFDHLIFKYTHGAIALAICHHVINKKGLGESFTNILEQNPYFKVVPQPENEQVLIEIQNELKAFEKIDPRILHSEAGLVLKQTKELFKRSKMFEGARGFQLFIVFLKGVNGMRLVENQWKSQTF